MPSVSSSGSILTDPVFNDNFAFVGIGKEGQSVFMVKSKFVPWHTVLRYRIAGWSHTNFPRPSNNVNTDSIILAEVFWLLLLKV